MTVRYGQHLSIKGMNRMMEYEVYPRRWGYGHIITSPIKGSVESIKVESGEKVRTQQLLAMIQDEQSNIKRILSGASGVIETLAVKAGDKVVRGDVLFYIKEDEFVWE
ncbi:biotin/lipoyl-binding protein [Virgibacillus sp. NKC19-3]|uniref:biotin/lipoyl-binding protein n=1 Tax=Virgibacillus saliphilus TaxID=2831674 RepID=UPI001C9AD2E9|nr:biotin/lipoyl-binding protein [Virgibacillus sp. NKC19-3]MBY7144782.1 biotin/lipoyl-binding protein [Virgibacillus sp. NKC19-3]